MPKDNALGIFQAHVLGSVKVTLGMVSMKNGNDEWSSYQHASMLFSEETAKWEILI